MARGQYRKTEIASGIRKEDMLLEFGDDRSLQERIVADFLRLEIRASTFNTRQSYSAHSSPIHFVHRMTLICSKDLEPAS